MTDKLQEAERALRRATWIAEHLFTMIDRETWRATGGNDGQGHYEGDYHAEMLLAEIRELAALVVGAASSGEPPSEHEQEPGDEHGSSSGDEA